MIRQMATGDGFVGIGLVNSLQSETPTSGAGTDEDRNTQNLKGTQ